jgi:hypothetical protein
MPWFVWRTPRGNNNTLVVHPRSTITGLDPSRLQILDQHSAQPMYILWYPYPLLFLVCRRMIECVLVKGRLLSQRSQNVIMVITIASVVLMLPSFSGGSGMRMVFFGWLRRRRTMRMVFIRLANTLTHRI